MSDRAVGRVVVIGGGVSGALSAVRLLERGFDVTVVEKAAFGNGSSSRSAAGIRAQFGVEGTIVGMMYSEWWYGRFHDELRTPPERRQPVMRRNGYLFLYDDPGAVEPERAATAGAAWSRARANAEKQRQLGLLVELLAADEVGRRWPHLRTERLVGATWCPEDGFLAPVAIYGEGFRRASQLGGRLLQRTEVVGAERRGGRIVALETTDGRLEADWFVNCTNAWAPRLSRRVGGMELQIAPVKRFLYLLRPERSILAPNDWARLPMTVYGMGHGLGSHSRPEGELLLLAGGGAMPPEPDFADEEQDRVPPAFDHRVGVENLGRRVLAEVALYAPDLAGCGRLAATTCGYYGMTPDATPLIGVDRALPNLVHAAGFSGHGIMHAPITARLVEAIVCGDARDGRVGLPAPFDRHAIDLAVFDPGRDVRASERESAVL